MFLLSPERFSFSPLFFFSLFPVNDLALENWFIRAAFWAVWVCKSAVSQTAALTAIFCHPWVELWRTALSPSQRREQPRAGRDLFRMMPFKYTGSIAPVLVPGCRPGVSLVTFDLPVGHNGPQPWLHLWSLLESGVKPFCLDPTSHRC